VTNINTPAGNPNWTVRSIPSHFQYSHVGGKVWRTYRDLSFHTVASTEQDITWFMEQKVNSKAISVTGRGGT
jgi:hypothetical protein